ncbi:RND transporter family protein [Thiomicrolovo sp. ZZH C-3]
MKLGLKTAVLLLLLMFGAALMRQVEVRTVDWSHFFPDTPAATLQQQWFTPDQQYLFAVLSEDAPLLAWRSEGVITDYFRLDRQDLYLLTFSRGKQNALLARVAPYPHSGTAVVGALLLQGFFDDMAFYLYAIAPFLLLLLWLLTSLTYLLNILIEIGTFTVSLLAVLVVGGIAVDPAALLAIVFLIIYALTLFNYLHSGEIGNHQLAFGITLSIATTALSSLFLYGSDFGLINTFGKMMLIGLGVLYGYLLGRIYLFGQVECEFGWRRRWHMDNAGIKKGLLLFGGGAVVCGFVCAKGALVDLNPLNLMQPTMATYKRIAEFESGHLPTLPFVVRLRARKGDFSDLKTARALAGLTPRIAETVPGVLLGSLPQGYQRFAAAPLSAASPDAYAQYLLALEWLDGGLPLLSPDRRDTYMTLSIPITTPSYTITAMVKQLQAIGDTSAAFSVSVLGKIADFEHFLRRFAGEFIAGVTISLGFVVLFFLLYCRTWKSVIVLVSPLLSLLLLAGIHRLLGMDFTMITLLGTILFIGLVTDSIIHLFICIKHKGHRCIGDVLRPIIVSNMTMLIGLAGMLLGGTMIRQFGLELGILLAANLAVVVYLLPVLLKRHFTRCG